jgi:hypothetical protein
MKPPITTAQLAAMSDLERKQLSQFAEILGDGRGSTTPAEEFITGLVSSYIYTATRLHRNLRWNRSRSSRKISK